MAQYKQITFGEGIKDISFSDFKEQFSKNWVFAQMPPKEREKELKKAYKVATGKSATTPRNSGKRKGSDSSKG